MAKVHKSAHQALKLKKAKSDRIPLKNKTKNAGKIAKPNLAKAEKRIKSTDKSGPPPIKQSNGIVQGPNRREPRSGESAITPKLKVAHVQNEQKTKPVAAKPKKEKKPSAVLYDVLPFDEGTFFSIVNVDNVKQIAQALKKLVESEISKKKTSIFEDYRYMLQVVSFKIANCPKRMVKLNVKNPLVDKDNDVLLVVADLQRGAKVDYEPTKQHYEDLLRANNIEGITVMPMNQLRKEYQTFESKRRLCASYDYFLCDGRIVSHVTGFMGKITQRPRHTFHAVRLHGERDVKREITKSMCRTSFRQLARGDMHTIPVGSHKHTDLQIAENIDVVVNQLKTLFPGGLPNIRALHLKIDIPGTSSLPLYVGAVEPPEETPNVIGTREKRMLKMKRAANDVLLKFSVGKTGDLTKLNSAAIQNKRKLRELESILIDQQQEKSKVKNSNAKSGKRKVAVMPAIITTDQTGSKRVKKASESSEKSEDYDEEDDQVVHTGSEESSDSYSEMLNEDSQDEVMPESSEDEDPEDEMGSRSHSNGVFQNGESCTEDDSDDEEYEEAEMEDVEEDDEDEEDDE